MTPMKKLTLQKAPETALPVAVTPMAMLQQAVQAGADVAVLERLMDLHERWQAGQAKMAFAEAISNAKAKIKPIRKNRKVDFTSAKGRTNYEYADLGEIARTVDPIISECGLSYRYKSRQEGKRVFITCVLAHSAGHTEENELSADNDETGNKNAVQSIGSTITYLQRMTLCLALGLAASKDDDGKASAAPKPITDAQLDELIAIADDVNANKAAFCRYYGIEVMKDLPASKFEGAKKALLAKKDTGNGEG